MFAKPFKVKSNNSLKNSEKKHLVQRIVDEFPAATEEVAKELVPMKSSCSCVKVTAHSGEVADVYVVSGAALLLDVRGALLPTAAALWRARGLLPALTVHEPVLAKIQGGAPLYLPGVVIPTGGTGFPVFARGAAIAVRTTDNAAAGAVGRAALASGEMLMKVGGVCMEMVHWVGDTLSREPKFGRLERPRIDPALAPAPPQAAGDRLADQLQQLHVKQEEWPALGRGRALSSAPAAPAAQEADMDPQENAEPVEEQDDGIPTDMDGLLEWALLGFLKLHAKTVQLPLLSSLLYRNYLLPLCPPDRTMDVKKSSYKKVGKFLEAMQKEGYLQVREMEKGVDAVTALNPLHPRARSHAPPPPPPPPADADDDDGVEYTPPQVREMFSVTAAVSDLLALKKGSLLSSAELRALLTEYVTARGLPAGRGGAVLLDAALARALQAHEQETVKWDALMAGVQARLTACTEMRFADGTSTLTKAKLDPIKMQVVNRSGNKKVTLVSNLEAFGFTLPELARACQRGVAASCGVTRSPGSKFDQLMLQGDQQYYVARLLIEKYGLPKKFVEGADKALKKKKGS
ncbi:eukaryotic translation initiation factor 2D [Leguminivora glycinivorella]|uniref:eukaryotic translation initiation factor 2D n=1 Tax=Leguminivora glycinivorella TaxID=1035111 RepID=UPI00200BD6BA|nr:eukaryotic translation initiation factor 2D [Leguminivora glycinivorella]